jgi:quinol monooxygenase YgiN
MAYCVAVRWTIREGELEPVLAALKPLIEASRAEPGCLMYQAHRDPEDPDVLFLYERYVDEDAFRAHAESEHFKTYAVGECFPRRASSERTIYTTFEP